MQKKTLILVLSADFSPYDKMISTSQQTWDSIEVDGCETIYYCGLSSKKDTNKIIYLPVKESLHTMGIKLLLAFEWALENKEFNYIARPHSCIYVDKKQLIGYIQELPVENVFAGPKVDVTPPWLWGGLGYILSKDVVRKIVDNKDQWDHTLMEDMALSFIVSKLNIPFTDGAGCSIDKYGHDSWLCLSYGESRSKSFIFTDFSDVPLKSNQFFYRVKQDNKRDIDELIMRNLFEQLK